MDAELRAAVLRVARHIDNLEQFLDASRRYDAALGRHFSERTREATDECIRTRDERDEKQGRVGEDFVRLYRLATRRQKLLNPKTSVEEAIRIALALMQFRVPVREIDSWEGSRVTFMYPQYTVKGSVFANELIDTLRVMDIDWQTGLKKKEVPNA